MSVRLILLPMLLAGAMAPSVVDAAPKPYAESRTRLYAYAEGVVFEVLARPGRLVDIVLEPGERLAASGPIAAGDTARWIIGDAVSGPEGAERVHVLVKPVAAGLSTNLVINTTRRTYHLDLRSATGEAGVAAQVAWRYAPQPIVVVLAPPAPVVATAEPPVAALNLAYRIKGPRVTWRPVRVFDDGRRTYVEFGPGLARGELPPLFAIGPDGKGAELINVQVDGGRMVVDRLLDRAELRLGQGRSARRVSILREAGR